MASPAAEPLILTSAKRGDWDTVRRLSASANQHELLIAVRARDSEGDGNSLVHFLAASGPLDLLSRLVDASSEILLARNRIQQTPLVCALLRKDPEGDEIVKYLLARGAAKSIFVAGYAPDLLVVSLPMARKPLSKAVSLPKPAGVSMEHLSIVDAALANHVALLDLRYSNTLVPDNATLIIGSIDKPRLALPPVIPPPRPVASTSFDVFPARGLEIGDIVEVLF
jgi:hypothetical protein